MNDCDLVRGLSQRDPEAFQCLSERYLPSVWRYVYTRVGGDSHLAEDLVSETVLALVKTLSASDSEIAIEQPGAWLRSVAHNKIQDHFRAAARVRHLIDEVTRRASQQSELDDPPRQRELREQHAEIRRILDGLSDQFRMALEWKYLDQLSVREMAARWEVTEKAVESILYRARREFRRRLVEQGEASPDGKKSQGRRRVNGTASGEAGARAGNHKLRTSP